MIPGASTREIGSPSFRSGLSPLRKGWARTVAVWACAGALLANVAGCYTHRQIDTSTGLVAGQRVVLDLTDQGRARLAGQLGGSVTRIQGAVVSHDGEQVTLAVSRVGYIGGSVSNWSGEAIRLQREDISRVQERQLAPVRTGLLAGGIVAALVVLTLGLDWIGFGSDEENRPGPDGDSDT